MGKKFRRLEPYGYLEQPSFEGIENSVRQNINEIVETNNQQEKEIDSKTIKITASPDGTKYIVTQGGKKIGETDVTVRDVGNDLIANIHVNVVNSICPNKQHPHMIDLGLPSGTLWACCNVGSSSPEERDAYFAWGETFEKDIYDKENYDYDNTSIGDDISGSQYDVAYMYWGNLWQMPSVNQANELYEHCTSVWTTINNSPGRLFTGYNGNCIFLPAAGYIYESSVNNLDSQGYYWTSSNPNNLMNSHSLFFDSHGCLSVLCMRSSGASVRPISNGSNDIRDFESHYLFHNTIYNIYGVKIADNIDNISSLAPGIYAHVGACSVS